MGAYAPILLSKLKLCPLHNYNNRNTKSRDITRSRKIMWSGQSQHQTGKGIGSGSHGKMGEWINYWFIVSSNLVREINHTNKGGGGEVKRGDNKLQQKGMEPSVDAVGIGVCAREEVTVCVCIWVHNCITGQSRYRYKFVFSLFYHKCLPIQQACSWQLKI